MVTKSKYVLQIRGDQGDVTTKGTVMWHPGCGFQIEKEKGVSTTTTGDI